MNRAFTSLDTFTTKKTSPPPTVKRASFTVDIMPGVLAPMDLFDSL
jgi:hypothetical protein